VGYEYHSDHGTNVIEIIPEYGCEATGDTTFRAGLAQRTLRVPGPLRKGDQHVFSFRMVFHTTTPLMPPLLCINPQHHRWQATLHLQFDTDFLPESVWRFSDMSNYDLLQETTRKHQRVSYDRSRFVHQQFSELRAGLCHGVTWDWRSGENER
jgi:hypothetical protein